MARHIGSKSLCSSIASKDFQSTVQQMFRLPGYSSVSVTYCQPSYLSELQVIPILDNKWKNLSRLFPSRFFEPGGLSHVPYLSHLLAEHEKHLTADS